MKKIVVFFLVFIIAAGSFSGCLSDGLTSKNRIVALYRNNEEAFIAAASSRDFSGLESIKGVIKVAYENNGVDIFCGGRGMGANTDYYGIMWAENGMESILFPSGTQYKYTKTQDGSGIKWEEDEGDNVFWYEPLGNDYYYYEFHYQAEKLSVSKSKKAAAPGIFPEDDLALLPVPGMGVLSTDLRVRTGMTDKASGFDNIVNLLQMKCFVLPTSFEYSIDRHGRPYGWGLARYSLSDSKYKPLIDAAEAKYSPAEAKELLIAHVSKLCPDATGKQIERLIK